MNKKNQISLIKEFINSPDKNILINQVNDDIAMFYLTVIEYYSKRNETKVNITAPTDDIVAGDDLFGTKLIQILTITNSKKLDVVLKDSNKKIVFTDYKNYKKLNLKLQSINGYQFENDLIFFIKNVLSINNDDLIHYCKNNTALLFSETSKYLVNSNHYSSDRSLVDDKNHILDIRKSIFENKRKNFDVKDLYQNIKKEAAYKKLSFLTY
jgi:hypothetical protein